MARNIPGRRVLSSLPRLLEHCGELSRPGLLGIERHRIGQILLKQFRRLVGRHEPIQAISIDRPEKHAETINLV